MFLGNYWVGYPKGMETNHENVQILENLVRWNNTTQSQQLTCTNNTICYMHSLWINFSQTFCTHAEIHIYNHIHNLYGPHQVRNHWTNMFSMIVAS